MRKDECNPKYKKLTDLLEQAAKTCELWEVWHDFIFYSALVISQKLTFKELEEEGLFGMFKYPKEIRMLFSEMFKELVNLLNSETTDVLGSLFMELKLNDHWKGQYFTPYSVSRLLSFMDMDEEELGKIIIDKGYIVVNDPACGAGSLLIGKAETLGKLGINYSKRALFIGQDTSYIAALMCYVQISLYGMAGYVIIDDTLAPIKHEKKEIWYTPMFIIDKWEQKIKERNKND